MKITFVSSEASPFVKTGELAQSVTALAKELGRLGHEITLMMPLYTGVMLLPTGLISPLRMTFAGRHITYSIVEGMSDGMKLIFIDAPGYFQRTGLYGDSHGDYKDNDERFIFFTRACLDYYKRKETHPDILHCHQWQTGLIPLFLKTHYVNDQVSKTPVVFTIHDIAFQGNFPGDRFGLLELGWEYFRPETLEYYGKVSFLKGGLIYADLVTTHSNDYAQEIQSAEAGRGMEGVLQSRKENLVAVEDSGESYLSIYERAIQLKS